MSILPDQAPVRLSGNLSHLVVSFVFASDGACVQVNDTSHAHRMVGSFSLDVAAGISQILRQGDANAVELARRFDHALAEGVYAMVSSARSEVLR